MKKDKMKHSVEALTTVSFPSFERQREDLLEQLNAVNEMVKLIKTSWGTGNLEIGEELHLQSRILEKTIDFAQQGFKERNDVYVSPLLEESKLSFVSASITFHPHFQFDPRDEFHLELARRNFEWLHHNYDHPPPSIVLFEEGGEDSVREFIGIWLLTSPLNLSTTPWVDGGPKCIVEFHESFGFSPFPDLNKWDLRLPLPGPPSYFRCPNVHLVAQSDWVYEPTEILRDARFSAKGYWTLNDSRWHETRDAFDQFLEILQKKWEEQLTTI